MTNKVSIVASGLFLKCPACGKGRVYKGFLKPADKCSECGLEISKHDAGDGPAYFVMFITSFLITALAAIMEIKYSPETWVFIVTIIPVLLISSISLLIIFKSLFISIQYKLKLGELRKK
jgi:uncharacterized protein (DUF983 family)